MKAILPIVGAVVMTSATLQAAEPTHDLTPDSAIKLIQLLVDPDPAPINVAMILEGAAKEGPFEIAHSRRVIAIHPVPENGRRVRRMVCYDFLWSEDFGWFAWQRRAESGGDVIYLWSETQGERVVK